MKYLATLFVTALLGIGLSACGAGKSASSASPVPDAKTGSTTASAASGTAPAPAYIKADGDKDNDIGAPFDDTNNDLALNYGHPADAADKQAVTALLKRYYAAALAGDGAKTCAMLYVTFAEAIPEDYGPGSAGAPYLKQGKTCPAVMGLLFKHFHSQLAAELPLLKVSRVRLVQHHGFAILSFGTMPEREITVRREKRTWKVEALLDGELP